jgi:hypothetical protein
MDRIRSQYPPRVVKRTCKGSVSVCEREMVELGYLMGCLHITGQIRNC